MTHEATVGKVSAEQVFYLMSRGLTENEATNLIVQGFLETRPSIRVAIPCASLSWSS